MHREAPSRRWFVRAAVAALVLVSLLSPARAPAQDGDPGYFSYRFGKWVHRVVAAADGTIYLAGVTESTYLAGTTVELETPFYVDNGGYRVAGEFLFVAALSPDGRPLWTSYLPAFTWSSGVRGLAVASDGSVWIAGEGRLTGTGQVERPTWFSGLVIARFAADGSVIFAKNLGSDGVDWAADLALLPDGDAIVAGSTQSADFPGAPSDHQSDYDSDAFVARVRADGSGFAWVRRYGGTAPDTVSRFDAGGVAVDADGTIVASVFGTRNAENPPEAAQLPPPPGSGVGAPSTWDRRSPTYVLRFDPDGETIASARVDFLGTAWTDDYGSRHRAAFALDRDGSILVGGRQYAARIAPDLSEVRDVWLLDGWGERTTTRLAVRPDGTLLLVGMNEGWYGSAWSDRLYTISPSGVVTWRFETAGVSVLDLALDARGDLCIAGEGAGAPFHAPYESTERDAMSVAKLPADGLDGVSNLRLTGVERHAVEIAWNEGPDPPVRYVVERAPTPYWMPYEVVAFVDAPATSARIEGLDSAASYGFRVVAEYASGVRLPAWLFVPGSLTTDAEPPADFVTVPAPERTVDVRWTDTNGGRTSYRVERAVGAGPWLVVADYEHDDRVRDRVPTVFEPVRYRMRALVVGSTGRDPEWVESEPIAFEPSLRVVQTRGRLGDDARNRGRFVAEGTVTTYGSPEMPAFDPAAEDLHVMWGDADAPSEFTVFRGDPGWTSADGVHTWTAERTLSPFRDPSRIVLDLRRGRYRIDFRMQYQLFWRWSGSDWSGSIAVNLAWGAHSGGDVRAWKWVRGRPRALVLR